MAIVALRHCATYSEPALQDHLAQVLEASDMAVGPGARVLVKPNLLMKRPLACASPPIVAGICRWLMDRGARVTVADSPGFGSAQSVAAAIGLDQALVPLGLKAGSLTASVRRNLVIRDKKIDIALAREALESDLIFSVARVKAHAQMRMTMCVKNCFGCVPGMRKALAHTLYGAHRDFFCELLLGIWRTLPPVAGVADGICAMHVTGPSRGEPYPLCLLGASANCAELDLAIIQAMGIPPADIPLVMAWLGAEGRNRGAASFPLEAPGDFSAPGFELPVRLASASFNPLRLARSCIRRFWALWRK